MPDDAGCQRLELARETADDVDVGAEAVFIFVAKFGGVRGSRDSVLPVGVAVF